MREYKFRAWSRLKKYMFEVNAMSQKAVEEMRDGMSFRYARDEVVLMQSTGLHDKNGREIYEGDIVRVVGTPYYAPCGAVTYNGKEYGLLYDDGFCADFTWEDWERYFEVIGNVYENPELLEADESLPKFCYDPYDPDSDHCRACLCPTCTYFWATDAGECVEGCELCGGKSWTSCIRYEEEK
ncbi:YopX family protein [Candidatus Darwinibacter acetoxidans]